MRLHPGPCRNPVRARPSRPVGSPALLAIVLLLGALASACAATTPGEPGPAVASTSGAAPPGSALGSDETRTVAASRTAATTTPSAAGWSVVPPAGLHAWQLVPAQDVSQVWRSGNCMIAVSAPADLPDATDEQFARAHLSSVVDTWIAVIDPSMTDPGDHISRPTDPLLVTDPTRTEPPAVHLQLSGFRYRYPSVGVTDQTYAFVTQGGGQGVVVSTVCSDEDFARRYDAEIAPLVADLGIDTGI